MVTFVSHVDYIMKMSFKSRKLISFIYRNASFEGLNLEPSLIEKLANYEIKSPTEIQTKAYQPLITGESVVINSETGSGKTLAYGIPIVKRIKEIQKAGLPLPRPYALILVPNTQLANQVSEVFHSYLGARTRMASEESPLHLLDTEVVVSTALYLSTYSSSVFKHVQSVVVDEADIQIAKKTGKHGKKDPLFNLIKYLLERKHFEKFDYDKQGSTLLSESTRQFVFVGATMPDSISAKSKSALPYIRSWIPSIRIIQSEQAHKVVQSAEMSFVDVQEGNKLKMLVQHIMLHFPEQSDACKILVFANKVDNAVSLYERLTETLSTEHFDGNFPATFVRFQQRWRDAIALLHSSIDQRMRDDIFRDFVDAKQGLLITTDISSRGLDIPNVDMVVQFDFATNVIDVLHRAGRTARMGKRGKILNFVTEKDEAFATSVRDLIESGKPLDSLFSRHRSLQRNLKKTLKRDEVESEIETRNDLEC